MHHKTFAFKTSLTTTCLALALFGSGLTQPAEATQDTASFGIDSALLDVHNRCIVRLSDDLPKADVVGRAKGLLARANAMTRGNAALKHVYQHSIKGFTIGMPCAQAQRAFGHDAMVQSLTPDSIVHMNPRPPGKGPGGGGGDGGGETPDPQTTPWGISRVGGPVPGAGYTAWVIDTGIDLDHPDLVVDGGRGFSAFTKGKNAGVDDGQGHGTHVAGTIAALDNNRDVVGVAAGATVIPVKVLDARGSGSTSGVIAGIDHVANNAEPGDCANMSLGGGVSQILDDAVIAAAARSGAYFVLAAGNDGNDANGHSPARANGPNVFTISASDSNDSMASFSNYGNPPVDYAAPGVGVLSTKKGGGTVSYNGTSMAAPHACAVLMLTGGNPATDGVISGDPDSTPDSIIAL